MRILQRQERRLRNRTIPMIKVQWANHTEQEATWETETDMRNLYPELFGKSNFEDEILFKGGRM
ncbi:hypothetical protein F511_45057 [Dorcoceras hygrometricum]|uniref:Chromo domain-containing protein n=1 Tax=Dorcoceras hygrometricum TaxID=472368 RepID=A0A2Z6ZWZ8_9LAMI|nr:hypothetical protein F511_45057 [Dorcoceras hygrometricum]